MATSFGVLRTNRNFRLLFIGQTISQLGDWFNTVALMGLLAELFGERDAAMPVALLMVAQFLPMAIVGTVAGVVVDRVDRRRLMIAADVLRGTLVLGLLLVNSQERVWLAYAVTALTVTCTAFFEPARTATIPNVTSADELLPASALSSAVWSAMLAIGASLGGLISAISGRHVAFVLNAASFFVSAWFISRTRFDGRPARKPPLRGVWALTGVPDMVDGMRYVAPRPHLGALMFVKAGWGMAGGVLVLLAIFGTSVFPLTLPAMSLWGYNLMPAGASAAAGIGILYGARGVGAGLGPLSLRWLVGQSRRVMRRAIGPAFFLFGGAYIGLAVSRQLPVAAACVLLAHFGGSILWVFSTVLLQLEVPDEFRGRVFSAELALVTLTSSASSYLTALALQHASPRAMAFALGGLLCVPGALWLMANARWGRDTPADVHTVA